MKQPEGFKTWEIRTVYAGLALLAVIVVAFFVQGDVIWGLGFLTMMALTGVLTWAPRPHKRDRKEMP